MVAIRVESGGGARMGRWKTNGADEGGGVFNQQILGEINDWRCEGGGKKGIPSRGAGSMNM